MDIVVLAGGLSTERDVSVSSGVMVAEALRSRGHRVVLLDVFLGYEHDECDPEKLFEQGYEFDHEKAAVKNHEPNLDEIRAMRKDKSSKYLGAHVEEICRYADIAFLALHGGDGENGRLQATFDLLGIKYTGSGYLGSAAAMNKDMAKSLFLTGGVNVPKGGAFSADDLTNGRIDAWSTFPCVVKPCSGGSSVGVHIVKDKEELLADIKDALSYEDCVLVEQYISGREMSVGVIDGEALPIVEIVPKQGFYDYVSKYQSGLTDEICPASLDEDTARRMSRMAVKACGALKIDVYGRADFILDKNGEMYCLEVNTLPGMTSTSLIPQEAAAAGIGYGELCEKIALLSLKKYE